jgi:hypothetical protein
MSNVNATSRPVRAPCRTRVLASAGVGAALRVGSGVRVGVGAGVGLRVASGVGMGVGAGVRVAGVRPGVGITVGAADPGVDGAVVVGQSVMGGRVELDADAGGPAVGAIVPPAESSVPNAAATSATATIQAAGCTPAWLERCRSI